MAKLPALTPYKCAEQKGKAVLINEKELGNLSIELFNFLIYEVLGTQLNPSPELSERSGNRLGEEQCSDVRGK